MNRAVAGLLTTLFLWAGYAAAEDVRWSLEVKGGTFHSDDDEWGRFYGDNRLRHWAVAAGYRVWQPVEIGMAIGHLRDRGKAQAPLHGILSGDVEYRLVPVQLSLTWRGVFREDQWLVPYVGAAYSRFSYRTQVESAPDVTGTTNGATYRAGLQFLLDTLDPKAALSAERGVGLQNTWFFIEAQRIDAEAGGADLGGTSYLGGILLEF